jgi:hypothetical protein
MEPSVGAPEHPPTLMYNTYQEMNQQRRQITALGSRAVRIRPPQQGDADRNMTDSHSSCTRPVAAASEGEGKRKLGRIVADGTRGFGARPATERFSSPARFHAVLQESRWVSG